MITLTVYSYQSLIHMARKTDTFRYNHRSIEGIKTKMNDIKFAYCEHPRNWGVVDGEGLCTVKVDGAQVGISYDIVVNIQGDEPLIEPEIIDDVVRALESFRGEPTAVSIIAANKRVVNFLKKVDPMELTTTFDSKVATEEAEFALGNALTALDLSKINGAGQKLEKLAVLQVPVDHFFDKVMVMAEDEEVRKNRLGLLRELRRQFLEVADFSLLQ